MAGYPPQQHYASVHQPPHVAPYHVPGYPVHPPPAPSHLSYQPHMAPGAPYQSNYAPPPTSGGVGNSGTSSGSHPHPSQPSHSMHQSHNVMNERGGAFDSHHSQSIRPSSQAQQAPQAGPSLTRPPFGSNGPPPQSNNVQQHQNAVPPQHGHSLSATPGHGQSHPQHSIHPSAGYGVPMHPREYEQQPPPLGIPGPRSMNQNQPINPPSGSTTTSNKRSNAAAREKDREGAVVGGTGQATSRGTATKAGGAKRGGQESKVGASGNGKTGATAAAAEKNAAALNLLNEEPIQESKKIRKRKEVVDRIHKVHWDTMENREILYNDLQQTLATTSSVLLLSPSLSRPYLMGLHRLTLERDAQLRQSALLHAHQVDSARMAYEQEKNKVEDEARTSKKLVREKLLAAVEDRRRRLREDKEGGEGMADTLLDPSTRPHATRKLRNKGSSSSKRDADSDAGLASRVTMPMVSGAVGANGSSLGLLLNGGAGGDGTPTARGGGEGGAYLGTLSSLAEFGHLSGIQGPIASLPPSNFDSASNNAVSLLHLQGVGGGMGDTSFMLGSRVALQNQGKGKKKSGGKGTASGLGAGGGTSALNGPLVNGSGGDDDEDGNGANARSVAAAAAAAAAAASIASGAGRLRWDQGKSVGQLTSAKDIEIESDLINIRKSGGKRRRR